MTLIINDLIVHNFFKSYLEEYGVILTLGDMAEVLRTDLETAKEIAIKCDAWEDPNEGLIVLCADIEKYIYN